MRIAPRKDLKYAFSGDTFFHLYMGRAIRENKFKIPNKIPNVVLDHDYTYPYLYHWLLSRFDEENRLKFEKFTGAIFDTINTFLIYIFVSWCSAYFDLNYPLYFSLLVAGLYAASPAILSIAAGPRSYSGSPRIIGQTLYFLHIFSFFYFESTNNIYAFVISLAAASLIFITAKFGVQVLLLFGILFSFYFGPIYALSISISFVLSILYTKGRSLKVLIGHFKHSQFYYLFMESDVTGIKRDFMDLRIYLSRWNKNIKSLFKGNVKGFIEWIFNERYFIHFVIIAFPFLITVFFISNNILPTELYYFLFYWLCVSIVCFVLTSFGYLRFLGEGERYLEYSLPALLFLALTLLITNKLYSLIILYSIYSLFIYSLHIYLFRKRFIHQTGEFYIDEILFQKINKMEKGVMIPIGNEWQTLYRVNNPLITYGANIDISKIPVNYFRYLFYNAHMPSKELDYFIKQFKAKYILATHENLKNYISNVFLDKSLFESKTKVIAESKNYIFLEINTN